MFVTALAAGAGCQEEYPSGEPPNDVRWQSPHFDYDTRSGETQACASTLDLLEQNFAALESYLGFAWPGGRKVAYHKYLDKDDYEAHAPCPADSGGCAHGSTVETPQVFDRHELVHAYLAPSGNPPALFKEGLATALACSPNLSHSSTISWRDALAASSPIAELGVYTTGGMLVGYLLSQHGPEPFMRLYRSLDERAEPDIVDAAIRERYGVSADEVWRQAETKGGDCLPIWPCSRDELPLDGSSVTIEPRCGLVADARTLVAPADGNLAIRTSGTMRLTSCQTGRRMSMYPVLVGQTPLLTLMPLAAGRYYIDYSTAAGMQVAARMLTPPSVGHDCAVLAPYPIGADEYPEIAILAPSPAQAWVARLHFGGPHLLHLSRQPGDATAITQLTICPDCDMASPLCQTVAMGYDGIDVLWDGDYVVSVVSPDPQSYLALELHLVGR